MESNRKVSKAKAQEWCKSFGGIPYYETSAKENVAIDEAFIEVAKVAVKREGDAGAGLFMPETIGGAGGAIKLKNDEAGRG
jgi:Ras-related protein Rab-7A